ncbi:two-component system sensor histidine kinase RppB [Chamaesiphon sp. OTE_20_metabat_361]|uniref:two-component system sensor histidine kinase RppB n=1 Tax=Chamaesiphon sp. OTE_20_metabat_361 TaxID=2964689 RepID=UPI00286A6B9B|nr:two-component system sensor histidine kinase RppB [Chamaesiphon sp. OTE_20_metabat_361]
MLPDRLFNRTRLQLTGFYAIVIGLITAISGYGLHLGMIRVFERSVDRELNTLAGTIHDTLETGLKQPEILDADAAKLLPGLCVVGGECSPNNYESKIKELTEQQGYCIRLLNLNGRAIANLGNAKHQFAEKVPATWATVTDNRGERYHIHTLKLKTIDRRDWGYLQVAQSFRMLDDYMHSLHTILLVGIPIGMLAIGGTSWWLSGLAMRPILESYQRIQQFTADAAHELRTPLSVMTIAVEGALNTDPIDAYMQNNLEITDRQIQHLSHLAADLLWLSRLEANQLPLNFKPCCANDLVSDLEEELAPLAVAKNIDLRLAISGNRSIYINGDSDRLYRAVANLIDNAIKYTLTGGTVIISLESLDRMAIISIEDNGIGIAAADLPQIFDRFYRVRADRARTTGGTGLGLAIVKAIISAHHGTIQVQSHLDRGSKFTIRLPIYKHQLSLLKTSSDRIDA